MKKNIMRKKAKPFSPSKKLLRGIIVILLCCLLVRAIAETADPTVSKNSAAAAFVKHSEVAASCRDLPVSALAVMAQSSFLRQNKPLLCTKQDETEDSQVSPKGTLYYHVKENDKEITDKVLTPVNGTYEKADYSTDVSQIKIKNTANVEFDLEELLSRKPDIKITADSPSVLIVHTHASEAYTPDGKDIYTASDPYRTENRRYNVVSLGDILSEKLKNHGVNVIHDRGIYDYPSYAGSYNRTLDVINSYLEKYPSISMVIDLHRDASGVGDSLDYKTTAKIGNFTASQVMMVVGTNASGLDHPDWEKNLRLAVHLQAALQSRYPGLARPISISKYRYNQHATKGSLILEIGYCGNTLEEAKTAVSLFSDACLDVILDLK